MLSMPSVNFNQLYPELFPVISSHLPLAYHPLALLALAFTCHQIHEIVVPNLLYTSVCLVDILAASALNALNAQAQTITDKDIQKKANLFPSHYIQHLCINAPTKAPVSTTDNLINTLHKLIDVGRLWNLSSLMLHIINDWDG
jgi:hypothetical protein